jgi:hypothetical protein
MLSSINLLVSPNRFIAPGKHFFAAENLVDGTKAPDSKKRSKKSKKEPPPFI